MQTNLPDELAAQAKRQAEGLTKLTELELSAHSALLNFTVDGSISVARQIELEFQRRSLLANRELKAANDRASNRLFWLTFALTGFTIVLAVVTLLQLVALHFSG